LSQLPSDGDALDRQRDETLFPDLPGLGDGLTPATPTRPTSSPTPPPPTVPAGWYPDPQNTSGYRYGGAPSLRYFDGEQWTEHRAPMQRSQQRQPYPQQPIYVQQNVVAPPVVVNGGSSSMAGLHLLLTLLTCGLWLPVWIIIEIVQASSKK
jgi:hypothetical protein